MTILHVKSIVLTHILCVLVVFSDFCRLKPAFPSLLFLSSSFDRNNKLETAEIARNYDGQTGCE